MQQVCHLRDFSVLEYIKEHNKQQEEKSANTENVFHHRFGKDEGFTVTRFVFHYRL